MRNKSQDDKKDRNNQELLPIEDDTRSRRKSEEEIITIEDTRIVRGMARYRKPYNGTEKKEMIAKEGIL